MPDPRPVATVSIDVDPLDLHLVGYGFPNEPPDSRVYEAALPRLLDALARHGIRATFFLVARDAPRHAAAAAALVKAGHEVASHSLSHPIPFRKLPAERFTHEIAESKRLLEAAAGAGVCGFRAPNWDLTEPDLSALSTAGYRYDASSYPSPYLFAARVLLAVKGTGWRSFGQLTKLPVNWRRRPHRPRAGAVAEFPVTVMGLTRFPVYHTLLHGRGEAALDRVFARCAAEGPLSYAMHAIDVLGLREDSLDGRLARHPGMASSLTEKLAFADRVFAAIRRHFDALPFRERLDSVPVSA